MDFIQRWIFERCHVFKREFGVYIIFLGEKSPNFRFVYTQRSWYSTIACKKTTVGELCMYICKSIANMWNRISVLLQEENGYIRFYIFQDIFMWFKWHCRPLKQYVIVTETHALENGIVAEKQFHKLVFCVALHAWRVSPWNCHEINAFYVCTLTNAHI